MRALALVVSLAAFSVWAEGPTDFRSTALVTPSASDALHRLALPFEAYRDARPDFADLRMFNARGEALPVAFGGDASSTREPLASVALALFPVFAAPGGRPSADLDVVVQSNANGTIVSLKGRPRPAAAARPVAWLLDASQLQRPLRALVLEWDAGPGAEIARVSVEGSDDLKSWRTLASHAMLVRLEQAGQKLEQPRVELGSQRAKYLRIVAQSPAFALRGVTAEPEEQVRAPARLTLSVAAQRGEKPGEYVVDLGARLPVEAVRVLLPASNSVAPFAVASRDASTGPWRTATSASFYRLTRDGAEIQSPPVEIPRTSARYWTLQLDPRSAGLGDAAPSLEVSWRPAQLVFVARGDAPYALAFGRPEARPAMLAVSELMPGYERGAEWKLAEAKLGEVHTAAIAASPWPGFLEGVNPRKLALWAVLVFAVAALGWMAWRLQRQMGAQAGAGDTQPRE